jgi:hypothetical protein
MVLKQAKSISQLKREIAEEEKRIIKESKIAKSIAEQQELSKKLFALKHKKLIGSGAKAKRISKKFGKSLLKVGKRAGPIIQKQAKLIRQQQLRDEKIADARFKKQKKIIKKTKKSKPKKQKDLGIFGNLNF